MAKPTYAKVMARGAHVPFTKDFLKLMDEVQRNEGWREEQSLSHWLECSARALVGVVHRMRFDTVSFDANEAEYMKLVGRCREPKETMTLVAQAYAVVVAALDAEPVDFLTPVFSEVAASSSLGQFFTPYSLSLASAQMLLQDAPEMFARVQAEGWSYIRCAEPACGVGGMVLAGNAVFRSHGIDPSRHVHWDAMDLDFRAWCGAYIQLTLTGASADVVHGNTLSGEVFLRVPTLMALLFPKRGPRVVESPIEQAPVVFEGNQAAFDFMGERAA